MRNGWHALEKVADERGDVSDEVALRISAQYLHELLGSLPKRDEDVLRSTFGVGREQVVITRAARELGLPKTTALRIRDRALRSLAERWEGPCPV